MVANSDTVSKGDIDPSAILRRISDAVHHGSTPSPDDMLRVAEAFDRILVGERADDALDLKKCGRRVLETRVKLNQRNDLLCEAAKRFFPDLSISAQATRMAAELRRYCAIAWVNDMASDACPKRHRGTVREAFYLALKCHDRELSSRTMRLILATHSYLQLPTCAPKSLE
jgi:hypothetical protein